MSSQEFFINKNKPTYFLNRPLLDRLANRDLARTQYDTLKQTLVEKGARLLELNDLSESSLFLKNHVVLTEANGNMRALLCRPGLPNGNDARALRAQLAVHNVQVARHVADSLEGGDVCVLPGDYRTVFMGHGFRTSAGAGRELAEFTGGQVVDLQLVEPSIQRLDQALVILNDRTALAHPGAFCPKSWAKLQRSTELRKLIPLSRTAALQHATDLIEVHGTVLVGSQNVEVVSKLVDLGHHCIMVPMDRFHAAGGGATRLVTPVHTLPARAAIRAPIHPEYRPWEINPAPRANSRARAS